MDKEATIDKACRTMEEASRDGAKLVVFSETFIPGYPYWRGLQPISRWSDLMVEYQKNALEIPSEDTKVLAEVARDCDLISVIGCTEMSDRRGSGTLYNTMLFIGNEGEILGRHRKLMPTHGERMVWGMGDVRDVRVFNTGIGTIGGLVCYEHHMTLLKAAMAVAVADGRITRSEMGVLRGLAARLGVGGASLDAMLELAREDDSQADNILIRSKERARAALELLVAEARIDGEISLEELLRVGHRVQVLRHVFNLREGIRPGELLLPARARGSPPLTQGPVRGVTLDMETMTRDYFRAMGYDEATGVPTGVTMESLGLSEVAQDLEDREVT